MLPTQIAVPTYAALLDRGVWGQVGQPYDYVANFLPLVAAVPQVQTIQIPNENDFLLVAAAATVTDAATDLVSQAFLPATVQISEQAGGRTLQNRAEHFNNIYGYGTVNPAGQQPSPWAMPWLLNRGSVFDTQITLLGATNFNVRISYRGIKLYGDRARIEEIKAGDLVSLALALLQRAAG
jgi:hypothetical protein